jgi:hypothetical protein
MKDAGLVQPSAAVRLQLEGPIFALVEDWRRSQPKIPSRSKALRLLIERALSARQHGPRPPAMRQSQTARLEPTKNSTQKFEAIRATSPT